MVLVKPLKCLFFDLVKYNLTAAHEEQIDSVMSESNIYREEMRDKMSYNPFPIQGCILFLIILLKCILLIRG